MKKSKSRESSRRVFRFQIITTLAFIVIIAITLTVVIFNSLNKSGNVLKHKVSSLISTIDVQMEINIDNCLKTIENTSTLVFSADPVYDDIVAYQYDPVENNYDEYDKIKIEDAISDKLIQLSLMENYCDFAVVYSDEHTVGKISESTNYTFDSNLYETMETVVTRQRTNDGWFSSNDDEFVRLYYAKRLNDNAILITSFYVTELESIFARSDNMSDMTIRLVDSQNTMIYSSKDDEIGSPLSDEIFSLIDMQNSAIITNDKYIVSVGTCGDEWKIICSIPTSVILAENADTRNYTIFIGVCATVLSIIVVAFIMKVISKPIKTVVDNLNTKVDTDLLTGIYNKMTYQEKCMEILKKESGKEHSLWIVDIDNFKNVNDTMGHAVGDQVIVGVAHILSNAFFDNGFAGRIGGDEFSAMITLPDKIKPETESYEKYIMGYYETVRNDLKKFCEKIGYNVTLSIGTSCSNIPYDELFRESDTAVYNSKKTGKDKITFRHKMDTGMKV